MIKYFIYSEEQKLFRIKLDKMIGKEYTPGKVFIDNEWREFTGIANDDSLRGFGYQDAVIVGNGNINKLNITYPKSSYKAS